MGSKPVAIISGAGGLIGSHVVRVAPVHAPDWHVVGLTRRDLDLTDQAAVRQMWRDLSPQLFIHCAALSKPVQCQEEPDLAFAQNVTATAFLANLAEDIPFVFLSTDQVFDGREGWYDEAAPVNPITVYAETKVAAERAVLENPTHTVIRTSLNAGRSPRGDRAFNEEMRLAWQANQTLRLFTDEFRCPIPAAVTARAIWDLVRGAHQGLYHVSGAERLSRWEIGRLLAARWPHVNPKLEPGSIRNFEGLPRQPDLSLNCAKAEKVLTFSLPRFTDWLTAHPEEPL